MYAEFIMLHSNYLLLQEEKKILRKAIVNNDTDAIHRMIQEDSIHINADISQVCITIHRNY